jgi:uncharacterized protein involved in exopolysaccharide biosynthesis
MTNASTSQQNSEGISLVEVVAAILRYRRSIVAFSLLSATLAAVAVLAKDRTFTTTASFTPQATRQLAGLGGLAAQLGVAVPTADGNQSAGFYADLLRSRAVLEPLAKMRVRLSHNGETVEATFAEIEGIHAPDSLRLTEAAIAVLRERMTNDVNPRTGIVTLNTKTKNAELSRMLTDSALGVLNSFNGRSRRSQASAQRQFLEQRLSTVGRELEEAEEAMRAFGQRNRGDVFQSPELAIQKERLDRAMQLRSQAYQSLAQALEQAKLDEIRDTPLITVIDQPRSAARADPRGLVSIPLIALVVGFFTGVVIAIVCYGLTSNRDQSSEKFLTLTAEIEATKADLRRMVWPLRSPTPQRG